ncbi:hypothetical protein HAX54_006841 [Datura stramonium]|uniref:Uncharacterized protein n=1 Tax=Datura stramonium TaxID=4076 RepID=A0ABS8WWG1_DATST|nr:hypothetical protein [Datura stramonium]
MEEYYISFKEKHIIHAEAQFDAKYFKTACPNISYKIGMRDWGPFTIPVDPYFPELVWEFYASYRERQQLLKHKGRTEAFPCLTSSAIKKALQPAKDKLTSLCSTVDVLESKVDDGQ